MHEIELTPAAGGWIHADWGSGHAWVRFGKDKSNKLTRITELHLFDPSSEGVRAVPLKRIEAAVTMRGAGLVQLALAMGFEKPPPAGELSRRPSSQGLKLEKRYRLKWSRGKRLDDAFYRDVAHAYQSAVAFGLSPRKAIVTDTGAADATVAGWVLEARRRDYLPATRPGKVSTEPGKARA